MYKDVFEVADGHIIGKITAKEGRHSFSVGRRVLGANKEPKVTFWFQLKHFYGIRKMLDRMELELIKLEEQTS